MTCIRFDDCENRCSAQTDPEMKKKMVTHLRFLLLLLFAQFKASIKFKFINA